MPEVRDRYAPSPTGALHLGGARTALFNFLFARQQGGKFLLRIEDTDRTRFKEGSQALIEEGLHWLGLGWDEPPLVQSSRKPIYLAAAGELLAAGAAYRCFCTPERLDQMRAEQRGRKEPERYDRRCRTIPAEEARRRAEAGERNVIRQAIPLEGTTTLHDLVLGTVVFQNATLDDHVLLKSDGFPTYHLAFAVDDHASQISHIIRGDGWLPSAPKHLLLFEAFGWEAPAFAHVPLVLGADKKPLAKRHGARDVLEYRDAGYLPEAVVNFIAFLGWSPGTTEDILTLDQLIEQFRIDRIQPSPAMANLERLDWLNGQFIRRLAPDELARRIAERMPGTSIDQLEPLIPLIQERLRTLNEARDMLQFFFEEPATYPDKGLVPKNRDAAQTAEALARVAVAIEAVPELTVVALEPALRSVAEEIGWAAKDLFMTLRVAITGRTVTPPLIESMARLGKATVKSRLVRAGEAVRATTA